MTLLPIIIYTQKMSAFVTQILYTHCSDIILQRIIYKLGVRLPVALPLGNTAAELSQYQDNWTEKLSYLFTKANAGENIETFQVFIAKYSD